MAFSSQKGCIGIGVAAVLLAGPGARAAFVPTDIANCILWLDGADLDGDGASEGTGEAGQTSGAIQKWDDKSVQDNDGNQGVAAGKPAYVQDMLNVKPVVRFDANSDYMDVENEGNFDVGTTFSIVFVAQGTGVAFSKDVGYTAGGCSMFNDVNQFRADANNYFPSWDLENTSFKVRTIVAGSSVVQWYINGVPGASYALPHNVNNGVVFKLGRRNNDATPQWFNGEIAELIIYDKVLTTTERQNAEAYLTDKWLPPAPPTENETFQAWNFKMKITFTNELAETLTDLPVLLVLNTDIDSFEYNQFDSSTAPDLRFARSPAGPGLNYELEKWDPAGSSYVWVRMPSLRGTNDTIWAFWGHSVDPPTYRADGSTWPDTYKAVWHMDETGGLIRDSTRYSRHGLAQGGMNRNGTGQIDGCDNYDGLNDSVALGNAINLGAANFTLSAWIRKSSLPSMIVLSKGNGYGSASEWSYGWGGNQLALRSDNNYFYTAAGSLTANNWHHVAFVRNGNTGSTYVDGQPSGGPHNLAVLGTLTSYNGLRIGRREDAATPIWFSDRLDEIRISSTHRSATWIYACWFNQSMPDVFVTYSPVQTFSGTIFLFK